MPIAEAKKLRIESWGEWGREPSVFDWQYSDRETAYVFEGDVIIKYGNDEEADALDELLTQTTPTKLSLPGKRRTK